MALMWRGRYGTTKQATRTTQGWTETRHPEDVMKPWQKMIFRYYSREILQARGLLQGENVHQSGSARHMKLICSCSNGLVQNPNHHQLNVSSFLIPPMIVYVTPLDNTYIADPDTTLVSIDLDANEAVKTEPQDAQSDEDDDEEMDEKPVDLRSTEELLRKARVSHFTATATLLVLVWALIVRHAWD